jgi:hypothetical protein
VLERLRESFRRSRTSADWRTVRTPLNTRC